MRLYLELSAVTRLLDRSKSYRPKKHLKEKKSIKSLLEAKEKKDSVFEVSLLIPVLMISCIALC